MFGIINKTSKVYGLSTETFKRIVLPNDLGRNIINIQIHNTYKQRVAHPSTCPSVRI